jgi:hypothetical protein
MERHGEGGSRAALKRKMKKMKAQQLNASGPTSKRISDNNSLQGTSGEQRKKETTAKKKQRSAEREHSSDEVDLDQVLDEQHNSFVKLIDQNKSEVVPAVLRVVGTRLFVFSLIWLLHEVCQKLFKSRRCFPNLDIADENVIDAHAVVANDSFTSKDKARKLLEWMIAPISVDEFYASYWEQRPLLIKRRCPNYYAGWCACDLWASILAILCAPLFLFFKRFSVKDMRELFRRHAVAYTTDLDVTRCVRALFLRPAACGCAHVYSGVVASNFGWW